MTKYKVVTNHLAVITRSMVSNKTTIISSALNQIPGSQTTPVHYYKTMELQFQPVTKQGKLFDWKILTKTKERKTKVNTVSLM